LNGRLNGRFERPHRHGKDDLMTETTLSVERREGTGKGAARRLRRAGLVPGVVYGLREPLSIQCDAHDAGLLVQALHGSERLISLEVKDGGNGPASRRAVLLKEVQTTAVGLHLIHIDFQEVDVSQTVQVSVEVHPVGKPVGEKMGGILQQVTREITVECLPTAIPDFLPLDVSTLEIGHSLHVGDIALPEGIKAITPTDETVFVMAAPRVEEEAAPEEAAAEGVPEGAPAAEAEASAEPAEE
jgi:large subunit ribosomal protein L25